MPRNSSGTYSLPVAAYVAGTTIKSADMNTNLTDIGTALTQSLATTGVSSMTGPVKLAAGSAGSPSLTLASDTTTGWYNSALGAWAFVSSGSTIITLGPSAVTVSNMTVTNLTVTGTFTVASARLVGEVVEYCGPSAPALWLLAYGQAISRSTYSVLFGIIGTAFGIGDGSTTFNVPDYRGRVGVGKDDMGGSAANRITVGGCGIAGTTLGAVGGEQTHALITAELAQHTHTVNDPGHTHTTATTGAILYNNPGALAPAAGGNSVYATLTINSATTGITNANTGSGTAHNNVQPAVVVNKIIYAAV